MPHNGCVSRVSNVLMITLQSHVVKGSCMCRSVSLTASQAPSLAFVVLGHLTGWPLPYTNTPTACAPHAATTAVCKTSTFAACTATTCVHYCINPWLAWTPVMQAICCYLLLLIPAATIWQQHSKLRTALTSRLQYSTCANKTQLPSFWLSSLFFWLQSAYTTAAGNSIKSLKE